MKPVYRGLGWIVFAAAAAIVVASCAPAATPTPSFTQAPQPTQAPTDGVFPTAAPTASVTQAVLSTSTPSPAFVTATGEASPTQPAETQVAQPTATLLVEERVVELEWPPTMRLGESDLIRISLISTRDGYAVTTEFPEHQVLIQTVPVPRPGGYDLAAVARLDGVGFDIAPGGDLAQGVPLDEPVTWRWTITPRSPGQQRLSLSLRLRWTPKPGNLDPLRETGLYSKGIDVRVLSFFGMSASQATAVGFTGLLVGSGLSLPLAVSIFVKPRRRTLPVLAPNDSLVIETHPSFSLSESETALLRTLFRRYARLTLEAEFRSGYSGARTFLALPVRADGRADAYTIAKIGDYPIIRREFENYETFVKDTLPPITARIQEMPVTTRGSKRAVLRYTFIGEAGHSPASLRETLLANPDPALLDKLFATFGPNWWMQRRPYTFRLAQEYDRLLPAHYALEPVDSQTRNGRWLDGRTEPSAVQLKVGDVISLRNFSVAERRVDGKSLSLAGQVVPGHPPMRLRWNSLASPEGARARVVATRETLLRGHVAGFDLGDTPDPLIKLPGLLNERVIGTQSTVHGDLNVENVLVGPGGFLWLIDFAQTRDGHPLFDFAHLEAEIIAHVIAPGLQSAADIVSILDLDAASPGHASRLAAALHAIASRCLFNPSQPREYHLALYMACLGAIKYANLNPHQQRVLYLAAAHLARSL
jgi:hypothetical protein